MIRFIILGWLALSVALAAPAQAGVDQELRGFVKEFYEGEDIKVNIIHLPSQLGGNVKIKGISFTKIPDAHGNGICMVTVEGKKGIEIKSQVAFKVLIKRTLYGAKSTIKRGDVIRRDDVTEREAYLAGSGATYPARPEDVFRKVAKKDISANEILTKNVLEERLAVTRGAIVSIRAENKRMVVQAKGVALEKGRVGDTVRAKAPSGKEIVGRVVSGNTIVVEF